jgi:hypothetical protein
LKFRIDVMEGLLVKYSVQHEVSGQRGEDRVAFYLQNSSNRKEI